MTLRQTERLLSVALAVVVLYTAWREWTTS